MEIGDRIIVINSGYTGTVVTKSKIILNTKQLGIKFDDPIHNKTFDPYYLPEELLEKI